MTTSAIADSTSKTDAPNIIYSMNKCPYNMLLSQLNIIYIVTYTSKLTNTTLKININKICDSKKQPIIKKYLL